MFIFAHRVTGQYLGTSGLVTTIGKSGQRELSLIDEQAALARAETNFGVAKEDLLALRVTDLAQAEDINKAAPGQLTATIANGELLGVTQTPAAEIWLHISVTGGDGQSPLGLANSGTQWREAQANFGLRQTSDPVSALIPVNDSFRMRLRDKATGQAVLVKLVTLTNGEGSLTLQVADNAPCGELELRESDFIPVMGYKVRLAQPFEIIIFEP